MSSFALIYQCDGCKKKIEPQHHKRKIRSMPCFHTLCNACLVDSCKNRVPRCPKCRKEWDLAEMRRFTCCGVCKYFRKQAVWHCLDCNRDMCVDCEKNHLDSIRGRDHQVLAIPQQVGLEISNKVREAGLDKEEDPYRKADLSSSNLNKVAKHPGSFLDDTNQTLPGVTCTSKLQLGTSDFRDLIQDKQAMVDMMVEDTEAQLSFFSDVLEAHPDLKDDMESTMDVFVQESIDQVQNIATNSHWDSNLAYEINVTGKPMDPSSRPEVHVKTKTKPHLNFRDVVPKHRFRLKRSIPVDGNARRVYLVRNRIMVSTWDASLIYNLNLELLTETRWTNHFETSAGVPIDWTIFVISDYEKGLYMIKSDGTIMDMLSSGCFSDVDVYDDKVVALEYEKCQVQIFQYLPSHQWKHLQNVALTYDNVSSGDTVRAFRHFLYVCSSENHCVFIYDLESGKFRQAGKYGKVLPNSKQGLLFYPRIAMADHYGNSLVADSWNKRLMILHDDDTWAKVDLGGQEGEIWDVYMEQGLENIWAISFVDGEYRVLQFVQR